MPHVFELAPSGRSKCRGCSRAIERGVLRFGERLPNPFADGEMTLWFHPLCAAFKRPEPLLEALAQTTESIADRESLELAAQASLQHRRLPRINGAETSPSSQAKCRHCREPIEKGAWRIRLMFFEEGMFTAGGFIHIQCRGDYFETPDVTDRVLQFSSELSADQLEELKTALHTVSG
jgi:hypothetical protein